MNVIYTASSIQGKRSSMQDAFTVINNLNGYLFTGVYDGHGGSDSANLASSKLHKLVASNLDKQHPPLRALKQAFADLDKEIHQLEYNDGTTASIALIRNDKLFLAHVGDSKVVMKQRKEVIQLTKDHKITDPEELAKYRSSNWFGTTSKLISKGKIKKFSLTNISRSLGDRAFEDAISPLPDIKEVDLQGNETIVLATDGIWGLLDNQEVSVFLNKIPGDQDVANQLTREALKKGSSDNITAIVLKLNSS